MISEADLLAHLRAEAGDPSVTADTVLFSSGLLDSVAMIALIALIEGRTGSTLQPLDVTLENFDSARAILGFLRQRG